MGGGGDKIIFAVMVHFPETHKKNVCVFLWFGSRIRRLTSDDFLPLFFIFSPVITLSNDVSLASLARR